MKGGLVKNKIALGPKKITAVRRNSPNVFKPYHRGSINYIKNQTSPIYAVAHK
jgi:hypothetical protein